MRRLVLLFSVLVTVRAFASDLVITAEHHYVPRVGRAPMAAVFTDERLVVNLRLDVYVLPQMPSTKAHYAELQNLTDDSWLSAVRWKLTDVDGHDVSLPSPAVQSNAVRHRGPGAALAGDRDTLVDCTTFQARLDFGPLPSGDLTLTARVGGLESSFPLAVRKGDEPEVRDAYLETRAGKATTFTEYRDLQLERYRNDPTHVEPVFSALDRALIEGSLQEARPLLALAIAKMEERQLSNRVRELRQVEGALPDYFAHRGQLLLVRDESKGGYVLKDRATGAVIRQFASRTR